MRKNQYFAIIGISFIGILFMHCEKADEPGNAQLSDFAKKYISMRLGSQNSLQESRNSAVNKSFQSIFGNPLGGFGGRYAGDEDSTNTNKPDSVINVDPNEPDSSGYGKTDTAIYYDPWVSCAVITENTNEDGSITTIYDYGDGCEEGWDGFKYLIYGKIISTFLSTNHIIGNQYSNEYYYDSEYDHYGTHYYTDSSLWEIDGNSHFAGNSVYDTLDYSFSGWYTYSDNTTYNNNGLIYHYESNGKTSYDNTKSVTESADYEYTEGDNYYKTAVLAPLVMDYSCWQGIMEKESVSATANGTGAVMCAILYSSGREKVEYRQGADSGEFIIDYGDGACDNIVTITENGTTVTVDLSQQWNSINVASNK